MNIIGNVFALCILFTVAIVFFQNKYYLTPASKQFAVSIWVTTLYCFAAIFFNEAVAYNVMGTLALHVVGFVKELLLLSASTVTAIYVIMKLIEHTHNQHHMTYAKRIFTVLIIGFVSLIISNPFTGWLYVIDAAGAYTPVAINYVEYAFILSQILTVVVCAIVNAKTVSKSARLASWQSLLSAIICIGLRVAFPRGSFLALAMALLLMVFFLNFQSRRIGVNTLTSLNDKRRFFAELENRFALGDKFNVFLIRLENYNVINSVYGHKTGDEVLYLFAFALERLIEESVAYHVHSTTFALVLPAGDKDDEYTAKILEMVEQEISYEHHKIKIKCNVVSKRCDESMDVATLYEQLTHTLNKLQEMDQNYLAYANDFGRDMERSKHIISRLQQIDSEHGFEVWFQPIWNVEDQRFGCMEALVRLREPDGSFISPGEFIPIAEQTGHVTNITWFVIGEVCRVINESRWLDDMRVSINLSMSNIIDDGFVDALITKARACDVDKSRISFEFTERVIRKDLNRAAKNMCRLVDEGFSFYLDDFGVGYSNFNCVLKLPLRTVKLDMSLTSTNKLMREDDSIVSVLTDLFHDMGLRVIAEGAETDEQVEMLIQSGVDGIQGYYFARPMPPQHLRDFLEKNKDRKI